MEIMEAMNSDVAKLPQWVQVWINLIGPLTLGSSILLCFSGQTRKLGFVALVLLILGGVAVATLYSQMGMVRLLGLGHVLFWLPLLVLVTRRLMSDSPAGWVKIPLYVLALTLAVTLAFDVLDVARWILGERGLIV